MHDTASAWTRWDDAIAHGKATLVQKIAATAAINKVIDKLGYEVAVDDLNDLGKELDPLYVVPYTGRPKGATIKSWLDGECMLNRADVNALRSYGKGHSVVRGALEELKTAYSEMHMRKPRMLPTKAPVNGLAKTEFYAKLSSAVRGCGAGMSKLAWIVREEYPHVQLYAEHIGGWMHKQKPVNPDHLDALALVLSDPKIAAKHSFTCIPEAVKLPGLRNAMMAVGQGKDQTETGLG